MVFVESQFVEKRVNQEDVSRTLLLQMAVSALLSKTGANSFRKMVRNLTDDQT